MTIRSIVIPIVAFTRSGGNRVLCRFASEWVRSGLEVAFLVLDRRSTPTFETRAKVMWCRDIDPSLHASGEVGRVRPLTDAYRLAQGLRVCQESFDVVLASHSFTAISCVLAGVRSKTIYYVQGYDPEVMLKKRTLRSYVAAGLAYLTYHLCRNQVVNSPHFLHAPAIRSGHVVPPGVDASIFFPKPPQGEIADREISVGIIGREEPHKFRPVLAAYQHMRQLYPRCKLLVAYGNIPAAELARCEPYEIVRPRDDHELARFYRECDVFLALSEIPRGAFYPPLEALASGTALIANPFMLVNPGNSWVVDGPAAVPEAFATLLATPPAVRLAKATRGIEEVRSALDWSKLAQDFMRAMESFARTGAARTPQESG